MKLKKQNKKKPTMAFDTIKHYFAFKKMDMWVHATILATCHLQHNAV